MHKEMTYYLYHIPGKKIGVTRDLNSRVVQQQGYDLDEIEVLDQSTDIQYISDREIELQKSYGYRVDRKKYKELYINKIESMHINATEQTSTFPVPVSKLKGRLMDNMGKTWETLHGTFEINMDTIEWIMNNVNTSQYTTERCYIYNKAFANNFSNDKKKISARPLKMITKIREWAHQRGIYENGDAKTQLIKLQEEVGELSKAILENDEADIIDAIGDSVVVLTNLAHLSGFDIEHCIKEAYNEISNRKGKIVNGTFIKDE